MRRKVCSGIQFSSRRCGKVPKSRKLYITGARNEETFFGKEDEGSERETSRSGEREDIKGSERETSKSRERI